MFKNLAANVLFLLKKNNGIRIVVRIIAGILAIFAVLSSIGGVIQIIVWIFKGNVRVADMLLFGGVLVIYFFIGWVFYWLFLNLGKTEAKKTSKLGSFLVLFGLIFWLVNICQPNKFQRFILNPKADFFPAFFGILGMLALNPFLWIGLILLWKADKKNNPNEKSRLGKVIKIYLIFTTIMIMLTVSFLFLGRNSSRPVSQLSPTEKATVDAQKELQEAMRKYPDLMDYKKDIQLILETDATAITIEEAYKKAKANRHLGGLE